MSTPTTEASPARTCVHGHAWLRNKQGRCIECAHIAHKAWLAKDKARAERHVNTRRIRNNDRHRLLRAMANLSELPTDFRPPPGIDPHWLRRTIQCAKMAMGGAERWAPQQDRIWRAAAELRRAA